jgi:hypothetical protein
MTERHDLVKVSYTEREWEILGKVEILDLNFPMTIFAKIYGMWICNRLVHA